MMQLVQAQVLEQVLVLVMVLVLVQVLLIQVQAQVLGQVQQGQVQQVKGLLVQVMSMEL